MIVNSTYLQNLNSNEIKIAKVVLELVFLLWRSICLTRSTSYLSPTASVCFDFRSLFFNQVHDLNVHDQDRKKKKQKNKTTVVYLKIR